jgi:epoxide hydrolase-like predicted phosphatase
MASEKNKIKAVIFDWGGVCCREGEPFASKDLQKKLAMKPEKIAKKVRDIYIGYYIGKYDRDSFWWAIINHFHLKETAKINPAALSRAYLNSYSVYQDVLDVVLQLQKKYQVALLSNLTPEMRNHIRQTHKTEKYFKPEVYSCDADVKSIKPDPKPYRLILKKMGLPARNCLFIDDSLKNIQAAQKLGFQTILFENRPKFFKEVDNIM